MHLMVFSSYCSAASCSSFLASLSSVVKCTKNESRRLLKAQKRGGKSGECAFAFSLVFCGLLLIGKYESGHHFGTVLWFRYSSAQSQPSQKFVAYQNKMYAAHFTLKSPLHRNATHVF